MNSRLPQHPVAERRLRPIYDLLDNGNNKKALQEAERVIKKQPDLQCAKVLKCLALIRLGKENESLDLLEAVRKDNTIEDAAFQLITACYREMHKPNLICELFEEANVKDPGNEDILSNLFLSYVRVGDLKKQQATALSLYKAKPRNQYYFWAIISLIIQTSDNLADLMPYFISMTHDYKGLSDKPSPIDNSKTGLLRLAEKMVQKHANERKIESEQEVLLYLVVLEMQGKLKEAFSVISGDLGNKLEHSTLINKRIDLLLKMEEWLKASELLRSVLMDEMDAWNYIICYLDSVFMLVKEDDNNLFGESSPLLKAKNFLEELLKENKSLRFQKRGPHLALIEFYYRLLNSRHSSEKFKSTLIDLLIDYVKIFGVKEACLHDLRPYLQPVEPVTFLSEVFKFVSLRNGEFPKTKLQMNLHLTNVEFCKVCGISDKSSFVLSMMQHFVHGREFNKDLLPTEPRSNDRYALLAVHTLFELWSETDNHNYLFEAIALSHYVLSFSPHNSQLKTLLLKFYHLLGGTEGAQAAFSSLDLKHMQLDTLGYMHVFPLLANADYKQAKTILNTTLKFFTHNYKESGDYITFAYKHDAWIKIPEFIHIRERLNYSTHYKQAILEKMLLEIFSSPSHTTTSQVIKEMLPIDKLEWGLLQDNRDFSVLWDLDPYERRLNPSLIQQTYFLDVVFLRLRCLQLEICGACIQLSLSDAGIIFDSDSDYSSSNYHESKANIGKLLTELENSIKTVQKSNPNCTTNQYIAGPPQSRLILFIQCNYFDPIVNGLKFLLCLIPGDLSSKENSKTYLENIILYLKEFSHVVSGELAKCASPTSRSLAIQMCSLFVEISSFFCLFSGVCESLLRKFKQSIAKKKKNKKDNNRNINTDSQKDFDWRTDVLNEFTNSVLAYIKHVDAMLSDEDKSWREKHSSMGAITIVKDIENKHEWTVIEKMSQLVNENLSNSYFNSLDQITTILKLKLKYISSHKI